MVFSVIKEAVDQQVEDKAFEEGGYFGLFQYRVYKFYKSWCGCCSD